MHQLIWNSGNVYFNDANEFTIFKTLQPTHEFWLVPKAEKLKFVQEQNFKQNLKQSSEFCKMTHPKVTSEDTLTKFQKNFSIMNSEERKSTPVHWSSNYRSSFKRIIFSFLAPRSTVTFILTDYQIWKTCEYISIFQTEESRRHEDLRFNCKRLPIFIRKTDDGLGEPQSSHPRDGSLSSLLTGWEINKEKNSLGY